MLEAKGVGKCFGERRLFWDWDFRVPAGQVTAVSGLSGAGKTTLLNCVGGLEEFSAGRVVFPGLGQKYSGSTKTHRRLLFRDVFGFLFQNFALVENWTVRQNLVLTLKSTRVARSEWSGMIAAVLERVGLAGRGQARVYTLSGGEQQRIALARLILKNPKVILADEPTSALDGGNAELVMRVLREFADKGALVMISTHSDFIVSQCDYQLEIGKQPVSIQQT